MIRSRPLRRPSVSPWFCYNYSLYLAWNLRGNAPLYSHFLFIRGRDEPGKQRVRLEGFGFEFRMKLAAQEPGMPRQLYHFNKDFIGRITREAHAIACKDGLVFPVKFVAVAVTF